MQLFVKWTLGKKSKVLYSLDAGQHIRMINVMCARSCPQKKIRLGRLSGHVRPLRRKID